MHTSRNGLFEGELLLASSMTRDFPACMNRSDRRLDLVLLQIGTANQPGSTRHYLPGREHACLKQTPHGARADAQRLCRRLQSDVL